MNHSYKNIVDEISHLMDLDIESVRYRVWKESLQVGSNVIEEFKEFEVKSHIYDSKMEKFYKQSYSFIFETLVESCRPGKRLVQQRVLERIEKYLKKQNIQKTELKILMFGDGCGSDSIYLYEHGFRPTYFDVPGSKTFEFAMKRFNKFKISIEKIDNYNLIPKNYYDVVICLEVLEHLPEPIETIQSISNFLRNNGIALITESFGAILDCFPTHLLSNLKYDGKTPFLFLRAGLVLNYYSYGQSLNFKPMEFIKKQVTIKDKLKLLSDKIIIKNLIKCWLRRFRYKKI